MENINIAMIKDLIIILLCFIVVLKSVSFFPRRMHYQGSERPGNQYQPVHYPNYAGAWLVFILFLLLLSGLIFFVHWSNNNLIEKELEDADLEWYEEHYSPIPDNEEKDLLEPEQLPPKSPPPKEKEMESITPIQDSTDLATSINLGVVPVDIFGSKQVEYFYVQKDVSWTQNGAKPALEKWEMVFPGKVHLGYDTKDSPFPYKILIGPFQNKNQAREFVKDHKAWIRNLKETNIQILF